MRQATPTYLGGTKELLQLLKDAQTNSLVFKLNSIKESYHIFAHMTHQKVAHIRAGSVKALGAGGKGAARTPQLPNVPSFAEQGMPTLSDEVWCGLLAPAGTPPAIVGRIAAAMEKLVASPETAEELLRKSSYHAFVI